MQNLGNPKNRPSFNPFFKASYKYANLVYPDFAHIQNASNN